MIEQDAAEMGTLSTLSIFPAYANVKVYPKYRRPFEDKSSDRISPWHVCDDLSDDPQMPLISPIHLSVRCPLLTGAQCPRLFTLPPDLKSAVAIRKEKYGVVMEWQGLLCNLLWTICILPHESTSPYSTFKTNQTKHKVLSVC